MTMLSYDWSGLRSRGAMMASHWSPLTVLYVYDGEGVALGNNHGYLRQLIRVHIEASHLAVNLQQNL